MTRSDAAAAGAVVYSPAQTRLLRVLGEGCDGRTAAELAAALGSGRSGPVTATLRCLQSRELVDSTLRRTAEGTRTEWVWTLTPHGRAVGERISAHAEAIPAAVPWQEGSRT